MPKLMNETKTGGAKLSPQQKRFHEKGESVTLTGKKAESTSGIKVNSATTETRVTRID